MHTLTSRMFVFFLISLTKEMKLPPVASVKFSQLQRNDVRGRALIEVMSVYLIINMTQGHHDLLTLAIVLQSCRRQSKVSAAWVLALGPVEHWLACSGCSHETLKDIRARKKGTAAHTAGDSVVHSRS